MCILLAYRHIACLNMIFYANYASNFFLYVLSGRRFRGEFMKIQRFAAAVLALLALSITGALAQATTATLKGKVSVGEGTRILAGSYIEGPVLIGKGCLIGPNCYIRPHTSIGDGCRVGNASEVKNSVIGDGSKIPHLNYVGDSVLGRDVSMAAGSITTNLRHDRGIIKSMLKGEAMGTGRKKLGAVIGDGVKLGARTIIYPGRKIWPGKTTLPGQIVDKDIE